jgi:hypothetical protein
MSKYKVSMKRLIVFGTGNADKNKFKIQYVAMNPNNDKYPEEEY